MYLVVICVCFTLLLKKITFYNTSKIMENPGLHKTEAISAPNSNKCEIQTLNVQVLNRNESTSAATP